MEKADILLLGHGYVAKDIEQKLRKISPEAQIVKTSRQEKSGFLHFDLEDPKSWDNLPEASLTYWTFPPTPEDAVKKFTPFLKAKSEKTTVVGTTGSFDTSKEDETVNEDTAFDNKKERARCEAFLLNMGFTLVMSAGIYGPGRNPLDWVRSGRVGKNEKFVNMIHIDDLVEFLIAASKKTAGSLYIASDANPQKWNEIISFWESKGLVSDVPDKVSSRPSKKLNPQKSIKDLNLDLKFRNFQEAVFLMSQPS